MVKRRLGRGLDFFLSSSERGGPKDGDGPGQAFEVSEVDISKLHPNPTQPRREFPEKEIKELSDSILSAGILQPILVRKDGDGDGLQIVAGERRWRAARLAGLERLPVILRDISNEQVAVIGLVENLHREDLNPIEKAQAFQRIQKLAKINQEEVARQVGLDRSTVANFLRLLELASEVQAHVSRGTLSMGHARALLALASKEEQKLVAEDAIKRGLNVRQVEQLVQTMKPSKAPTGKQGESAPRTVKDRPAWLKEIEDTLEEVLGTMVAVKYGKKRSHITIECLGRDEFERVYDLLKAAGDGS
ncbi:MAG: ParB/RepB/Spo0J family partition protein [Planctomycetota bacterium]|jgi:ParB family chromosome partitioning protein